MKPNPTPGPRREPINLYGIRMTAYNHLFYGVGAFDPISAKRWVDCRASGVGDAIRKAIKIWAGHRFQGSLLMTIPHPRYPLRKLVVPLNRSLSVEGILRMWAANSIEVLETATVLQGGDAANELRNRVFLSAPGPSYYVRKGDRVFLSPEGASHYWTHPDGLR